MNIFKDNPLNTELQHIVGDCIDDKQCKKCAINVCSQYIFYS